MVMEDLQADKMIKNGPLSERAFNCGDSEDKDINADINILNGYLSVSGGTTEEQLPAGSKDIMGQKKTGTEQSCDQNSIISCCG